MALTLLFAGFGDATPGGNTPSIVVLAGQSNEIGRKLASGITDARWVQVTASFPEVGLKQFEGTNAVPMVTVYDATGSLEPRSIQALSGSDLYDFGPELTLGRYLHAVDPNGNWKIVKFGVGGTDIPTNWNPSGTWPTTPNLFNQLITYMTGAEAYYGGNVRAFVWIQGESDAASTASYAATLYQDYLGRVLAGVRGRYPNLPIVFNQLSSASTAVSASFVRYGQGQFYLSSSNVTMVTCDEFTLDSGIHFIPNGYAGFGSKLGPPVLNILGYHVPLTASFSSLVLGLTGTFTDSSISNNFTGSIATPSVGGINSWSWDFGDGQTASGQGPQTHLYAAPGTYTVKLGINDYSGISVTASAQFNVQYPTWTVDATSQKGAPATVHEWNQILFSQSLDATHGWKVPASFYTCQDTTGNLADVNGGRNLTVANTPLYQLSETGWSRKFIGPNFGSALNTQFANATFPNLTASSALVLGYLTYVTQSANRDQMFYGGAGVNALEVAGGTAGFARYRNVAAANGTIVHTGSVHPFVIRFDRANQINALYTDLETVPVAYLAATTGTSVTLNVNSTATPHGSTRYGYVAVWTGSYAERTDTQIKGLLQSLGWAVSWTPTGT